MKITVRRIKLDSQGYDDRGTYWGVGERLYQSPEVLEMRAYTSAWFLESPCCRASDVKEARVIFKARLERMLKHPKPV